MRRGLLAAVAVAAAAAAPPAVAFPPECDRYGDKPCFTLCEMLDEVGDVTDPLFEPVPLPVPTRCGTD